MIFHTAVLAPKATRSTQGVNVMTLKPKYHLETARPLADTAIQDPARYRAPLPPRGRGPFEGDRPGGEAALPAGGITEAST